MTMTEVFICQILWHQVRSR